MIDVGYTTQDPLTQTRFEFIEVGREANGNDFVMECRCPSGGGPFVIEHVHLTWDEEFEIVSGAAAYKLDGQVGTATAGDTLLFPKGQKHIHPWNDGPDELVYRQTARFDHPDPGAVTDVFGAFTTLFALAGEGKTNAEGLPRNPLQFAATLRTFVKHEGFDASVPIPVQRVMAATLGRLAEAMGYRSCYPQHLEAAGRNRQ